MTFVIMFLLFYDVIDTTVQTVCCLGFFFSGTRSSVPTIMLASWTSSFKLFTLICLFRYKQNCRNFDGKRWFSKCRKGRLLLKDRRRNSIIVPNAYKGNVAEIKWQRGSQTHGSIFIIGYIVYICTPDSEKGENGLQPYRQILANVYGEYLSSMKMKMRIVLQT